MRQEPGRRTFVQPRNRNQIRQAYASVEYTHLYFCFSRALRLGKYSCTQNFALLERRFYEIKSERKIIFRVIYQFLFCFFFLSFFTNKLRVFLSDSHQCHDDQQQPKPTSATTCVESQCRYESSLLKLVDIKIITLLNDLPMRNKRVSKNLFYQLSLHIFTHSYGSNSIYKIYCNTVILYDNDFNVQFGLQIKIASNSNDLFYFI